MTRSILVTGGAGYVGSHACKALAQAGYRPVVYDNLSRGHAWAVRWGPLVKGDLLDEKRLRAALKKHRIQGVMHFAALAYAGESVLEPAAYYRNNIAGSLSLLNAMAAVRVRNFVFSSTCAVYGDSGMSAIPESAPTQPVSPYGFTKLAVERMAQDLAAVHGLKTVALRYFNAAGADPDGEIGEAHDPETHLLPILLEVAAGRRRRVEVYGDDYPTPDGTCVRDYVHVSDLARAHVLALGRLFGKGPGGTYNLGTGRGHSVREAIAAVERVTGKKVRAIQRGRREGDPAFAVADPGLAKRELGWAPAFLDLEGIVGTAWRWMARGRA